MVKITGRHTKILYSLLIILGSFFSAWVFYEVQKGIIQSHEELFSITHAYLEINEGGVPLQGLYGRILKICISLFGVNYNAQRLAWAVMYFFVSVFTFDLSLRDNEWNIKYKAISVIVILMVLIHLTGGYVTEYFGNEYGSWVFTHHPFTLHISATLAGVLSTWGVYRLSKWNRWKNNYIIRLIVCVIASILMVWMTTFGEFLFIALLVTAPLFAISFRDWMFEKKVRYYTIFGIGISAIASYTCMLKLGEHLPAKIYTLLVALQHKELSFKGIVDFRQQLTYYVNCLLATFNADLCVENIDMLTKWVYFARIVMVIFFVIEIYHQICLYFKKNEQIDVVDQMLAWGALGVSFGFIFTSIGNWGETKYLSFMLPYGTIMICRSFDKFLRVAHLEKAAHAAVVCLLIFAISYDPNWNTEVQSLETERLTSMLTEMDVSEGVGSNYLAPKIAVGSHGDIWAYAIKYDRTNKKFEYSQQFDSANTELEYFIYTNAGFYGGDEFSVEDIVSIHGEPDIVVTDGETRCVVYEDGIFLNEELFRENEETRYLTRYYFGALMYGDTNIERDETGATIHTGGVQRGPFASLEKNNYQLTIIAENFSISAFKIQGQKDGVYQEIPFKLVEEVSDKSLVQFEVVEDMESVEFVIENVTERPILLGGYYLERIK